MSNFFIDRPIFAWVIAILITLGGVIAIFNLGVESYPAIAPPQVVVSANYQGANADMDHDTCLLDSLPDSRARDPQEQVMGLTGAAAQVAAARALLSTLEEQVLDGYLEGKTYREMSTEMACVPKTIDNALQRVKRKIEANVYASE